MDGRPLPRTLPPRIQDIIQGAEAYHACLRAEESLQFVPFDYERDAEQDLVYIRVLGHLLHHVAYRGLETIVKEILAAKDSIALFELGQIYLGHFLRACEFPVHSLNRVRQSPSQVRQRSDPHTLQPPHTTIV